MKEEALYDLFRRKLMEWFASSHRPMPWKGEKDPYLIWLSEVILQQTRVEQGLPYFERFRAQYPDIRSLANAPEDELMKLWEGLGYYSRARNLHQAAKYVANELEGRFPDTYEGIRQLKGVGPYTAAAIASFAYGLPYAVVDGNVSRVLARFFGIDSPVDSGAGKKQFAALAQALLSQTAPGRHNQAMMDFGATHCTPRAPLCRDCPLQQACRAFQQDRVAELPRKEKKPEKKTRFFHYLIFNRQGQAWIRKRTEKDIWRNLYDFPLLELGHPAQGVGEIQNSGCWQQRMGQEQAQNIRASRPFLQLLTHQKIQASFWEIELADETPFNSEGLIAVKRENLSKFAFPRIIDWYLNDNSLYLKLL
ncbi:MAG: A/G-specific adenine glycosylase [Lewinellaceae bacterium]|nr:A/G-specific adenine glycosylase [Lewinellaceae bacterium]